MWGQAAPAAATGPQWQNQAEFDLFTSITKEANAAKRLEGLNSWKEKYPDTAFQKQRFLIYMVTYGELQQSAKAIEAAKQVLAISPMELQPLAFITNLTPAVNDTSAPALETGEKAAQSLVSNADTLFAAANKPPAVADAAWTQAKNDSTIGAHKTLAWIAMARKQPGAAADEYKKILAVTPNDAAVANALAQTIQSEKKVNPEVLFYYARALSIDGPTALPPDFRKKLEGGVATAYKRFHGSADGFDELKNLARTNAVPPADFKIKSAEEIAKEQNEKQAELEKNNPLFAMWVKLKTALDAPEGPQYFDSGLKEAEAPKLKGKLVSQSPALRPKTLVLALSDATTPEVTINLATPLPGKAEPGTELTFVGVAKTFTQKPFMITMDVDDKAKIEGWPAQAAPAPRRAAPKAAAK